MSKPSIQRISKENVRSAYLKLLMEYKNNLLLYTDGTVIYHDEEDYEYINKSMHDKRRKNFKGSNFDVHKNHGLKKDKSRVNQIIEFNKPYYMMKDNTHNSLFAARDGNDALVVNSILVPKELKKRYMTRDELEAYLDEEDCIIRYNNEWTTSLEIPTDEEILASYKGYVISEYIGNNIYDERAKRALIEMVNYANDIAVVRNYPILPEEVLLIKKDVSMSYITIEYEGINWFKVETRTMSANKYNLAEIKELLGEKPKDKKKLEVRPSLKKHFSSNKTYLKNI